jgi:hypothetical protein
MGCGPLEYRGSLVAMAITGPCGGSTVSKTSLRQGVQVGRPIQGDDPILEERTHADPSLGRGGMQGYSGFKADPVAFHEVQRLHPDCLDTPVILEHLGAIVQTDIHEAHETLGSVCTVVEAELANNSC